MDKAVKPVSGAKVGKAADASMAKDPVCGMNVDRHAGKPSLEHGGATYHFCSTGCHDKFKADPAKYKDGPPRAEPAPEGTVYTCPMHPEIEQVGPGECPICGMA
ncbi:Lead, cadmium, zinc and mercury transporting ATPase; Copper-translocating P-type ATPase, partial [hydrothermal vent metagenome]